MDDNELDRLFGKDGGADDTAPEKSVDEPDKEPEKKDAEETEPSDEVVNDSPFVMSKSVDSEEDPKENKDDDSAVSSEDEENAGEDEDKAEESEDSEETEDEDEDGEEDVEESKEDSEDTEEDEESEEETEEESEEKAPVKEVHKKAKPQKKPEKEQKSLSEVIPLNGKSIAVILLAIAVVVMVCLVMFLPAFRVRNCHVEGNVVLTDQEVLKAVGLEYDAHLMSGVSGNIFDIIRLDYGKTEERIKKENPYIEDIRITIKLPSTVDITIKERSKVCYVRTPDGYAALDKDGIVLELSSFDTRRTVQPVICGMNVTYAELGKPVKISNMNDYKKAIVVLGAILAADNASVGGDYCMFENTSEVRILPSGYIFLTIYSPSGNLIQIKLNGTDSISDDMAWLLYAFNADAFDKVTVDGALDMTGDEYTFREY